MMMNDYVFWLLAAGWILAVCMVRAAAKQWEKTSATTAADMEKIITVVSQVSFIVNVSGKDESVQIPLVKQAIMCLQCSTCKRYYPASKLVPTYGSARQENTCIGCLKVKTQSEHPARLG